MTNLIFRAVQFARFFWEAQTKYQIHSPFVFDLVENMLEDRRHYYSFDDIAFIRKVLENDDSMLELTDFGAGEDGKLAETDAKKGHRRVRKVAEIARKSGSSASQGARIFRLVNWLHPKKMLEMGSSLGFSSLYLGTAARNADFLTLEGCPSCSAIASKNLAALGLANADVVTGAFEKTLEPSLKKMASVDLVFFDGNHRREPTIQYFETCLNFATNDAVFIFDDIFWSNEMLEAWNFIKNHPRVTLTVDFFDVGLVFFRKENLEKQHFRIVPAKWKIWRAF